MENPNKFSTVPKLDFFRNKTEALSPEAVAVLASTLSVPNSCLVHPKRIKSIMNATKVRSEATQANNVATSATVACSESANAKANKETTVAVGNNGSTN